MTTLSRPTKLSEIEQNIKGAYADQTLLTINLQAVTAMFEDKVESGWKGSHLQQIMLNIQSFMADCGRLGLNMSKVANQVYLDFRMSKQGQASVGMTIMWQGWAKIASAGGYDLNCAIMRQGDVFEYTGSGVDVRVNPFSSGEPIGVFAIVRKGSQVWAATLTIADLEKRKAKSKTTMWEDNYYEMALAKVMRLACQRAGVIAMTAAAYDDDEVYEPLPEEVVPPAPTTASDDDRPF